MLLLSHVSCLSHISCLSHVSCLSTVTSHVCPTFPFSRLTPLVYIGIQSHVSCLSYVSCLTSTACLMSPVCVSPLLSYVSHFTSPFSRLLYHIGILSNFSCPVCLLPHFSCLSHISCLSHLSCLTPYASRLHRYPVSCLLSFSRLLAGCACVSVPVPYVK